MNVTVHMYTNTQSLLELRTTHLISRHICLLFRETLQGSKLGPIWVGPDSVVQHLTVQTTTHMIYLSLVRS